MVWIKRKWRGRTQGEATREKADVIFVNQGKVTDEVPGMGEQTWGDCARPSPRWRKKRMAKTV